MARSGLALIAYAAAITQCILPWAVAQDPGVTPAPIASQVKNPSTSKHAEDDLNPEGSCKSALEHFCSNVQQGEGKKAHCLRAESKAAAARKETPLADECKKELRRFFVQAFTNATSTSKGSANPAPGFKKACKEDISTLCPGNLTLQPLMKCMLKQLADSKLSGGCSQKVHEYKEHVAGDIRLDAGLYTSCKADLESLCSHLTSTSGSGKRKFCLNKHRDELSAGCKEILFKRGQTDHKDIRYNKAVFNSCRSELASFCGNKMFGEGRMVKCLWEKQQEEGFGSSCRFKVGELTAWSESDYRLDYRLRTRCMQDIDSFCGKEKAIVDQLSVEELFGDGWILGKSGEVVQCLKKKIDVTHEACRVEVSRVIAVHSVQWKADALFTRVCRDDVAQYCPEAKGHQVHLCLRKNLKSLGDHCKKLELLQGQQESSNIAMNPWLRQICKAAIPKFCPDVESGNAQVLKCLRETRTKSEFPQKCKDALQEDLEVSNEDWNMKHALRRACDGDAKKLCPAAYSLGGGMVLSCLKKSRANITEGKCVKEVKAFLKEGVDNIKANPESAAACKDDIANFCSDVQGGQERVHRCLLKHKHEISEGCAKAEFQNLKTKFEEPSMSMKVVKACKSTLANLCSKETAGANQWRCLEKATNDPSTTEECKNEVLGAMKLKNFNFLLNPRLREDCEEDAKALCPNELSTAKQQDFSSAGEVITCLSQHRDQLQSRACKKHLARKELQRLDRVEHNPHPRADCKSEIQTFCQEFKGKGGGQVFACLRQHVEELSAPCKEAQFNRDKLAQTSWKFQPVLRKTCKVAVASFCADVGGGEGKTIDCLLKNMHKGDMDKECRLALEDIQRQRTKSVAFNPQLQKACHADMTRFQQKFVDDLNCQEKDKTALKGAKIKCLTSHRAEAEPACRGALVNVLAMQSNDLRAKPGMLESCGEAIQTFCQDVVFGGGRVHKCLRENLANIPSQACKDMVKDVHKAEAEDALISPRVINGCSNEMRAYCPDVEHGQGRVLVCLQLHSMDARFGSGCKDALMSIEGLPQPPWMQLQGGATVEIKTWLDEHQDMLKSHSGVAVTAGITLVTLSLAWAAFAIIKRFYMKSKGEYTVVVAKEMDA